MGPLGCSGGSLRMAAMEAIQTAERPEASPRPAQGARCHGSRRAAAPKSLWSDLKGS